MAIDREKMLHAPIFSLLWRLALPTVVSMLISSVYNLADTYFVSQLGDSPTAGVSVVFSIQTLIQAIGFTLGMGAGSLISRYLGSGNKAKANQHASQAFFMGLALSLLFLLFGLIFRRGLVRLLGATETALPYAEEYALWILLACPFMMLSFILNNILRSEGRAALSMVGLGFGSILNLGLDPLFINAFGLGIRGAGLATMISQIASFLLLAVFAYKKATSRVNFRYCSKDIKSYGEAFACGAPTLVRQGFGTTSNIIISFLSKPYGDPVVAALGITAKIYNVVRGIVIGIGQGYQPILGFNYGAKQYGRIKKGFWLTLLLQSAFCLLATALVATIPEALIRLFRDTPEVIEVGTQSIRFLCIGFPLLGFSTIVNQALQITGRAKSASFLAGCRQGFVFTPVAFLFEKAFQVTGLCLTQPLSDLLTALISIPFCVYLFRKVIAPSKEKGEEKAEG